MGETRMHQYTPEIKQQSKKWTERLDPVPEKAKSVPSLGKVKAWVFCDMKETLLINYLEKRKTLTGKYYVSLLERLKTAFAEKCSKMANKQVLLHYNYLTQEFIKFITL